MSDWDCLDLNGTWDWVCFTGNQIDSSGGIRQIVNDLVEKRIKTHHSLVPGCFEKDLMSEGMLPDLYYGENILCAQEYENHHFIYTKRFTIIPSEDTIPYIVFEGVDTFAEYYLDGKQISSSDNMLIEHHIRIDGIEKGEHCLSVHIRPTIAESRKYLPPIGAIPMKYSGSSLYIRKAPHMFGWDIAPRLISGGIWRSVRIEFRPKMRIEDVYLAVASLDSRTGIACMTLHYSINTSDQRFNEFSIRCFGKCEDSYFEAIGHLWYSTGQLTFDVENPKLWWPKGRGDQSLYNVTVELYYKDIPVDTCFFKTGFRTVNLDYAPVSESCPLGDFAIRVNNEQFFVKGTNWVPADAMHSNDAERIPEILKLIDDIGCNAIRCWGGNVYENHDFYDICDAKGLIVWQDFAMACSIYPQDNKMKDMLRDEAISIVRKLRQHPSLCLWAGDNECDQSYMFLMPRRDPNRNSLTREVLPEVIFEHDFYRPFLPSSPYTDQISYKQGTPIPENHLWGARQYYKTDYYTKSPAKFVSEIGYHGCPSPISIKRFISPQSVWPYNNNPQWSLHSSSPEKIPAPPFGYRNDLMNQQIDHLFGEKMETLEGFALASQITQGEAMKYFIELFRLQSGVKTGIIWWNIMDCWPQFSDAVVDYFFTKKIAYWRIKESQRPVCLMIGDATEGVPVLYAVNDTRLKVDVSYRVLEVSPASNVILEGIINIGSDTSVRVDSVAVKSDHALILIEYTTPEGTYKNHYLKGDPPFSFDWVVSSMDKFGLLKREGFD